MEQAHKDLERFGFIRPEERDYALRLQSPTWGAGLNGWTADEKPSRHFCRQVPVHTDGAMPTKLQEFIVPFPSAPIYGINRKAEYGKSLERPNMHTIRVLKRPQAVRINRMFILHNGLNESDSLRFYYRLADWILREHESREGNEGAACLIVPFPGHLTHFSFHGPFSETPLSRYLSDAGELFRQFLRYMVGMRWLLSMVSDSDADRWMIGNRLITARDKSGEIFKESNALHRASKTRLEKEQKRNARQRDDQSENKSLNIGHATAKSQIQDAERLLRWLLRRDMPDAPKTLRTHVVGYSLGGFIAQCVFFAWPQTISSCTTICSGGAIRSLSPTAFADPEEWQSVLHSLRPELNNSMLQGRLGDDKKRDDEPVRDVAGIPLQRFGYFERIFDQVFLQEDRASYKERLSEYGSRLLFVSGGEDPIVRPTNILDASPSEGITMLSIASMTHFLNRDPEEGNREKEQRDFWLPEAGGLIARAAVRSERVHMVERTTAKELRDETDPKARPVPVVDKLSSSDMFESALDWVLDCVDREQGWLFVLRNSLPAAFLSRRYFERWGTALHHHDVRIQQYAAGLRRRAQMLEDAKPRTTLIVPEQLEHWFIDLNARFDAHSDAPSGRMTTAKDRARIWRGFESKWWSCIREFDAGNIASEDVDNELNVDTLAAELATWQKVDKKFIEITRLPDLWIGIKPGAMISVGSHPRRVNLQHVIDGVAGILSEDASRRRNMPADPEQEESQFEKNLSQGLIRIVQVSGAEFNPRYRGRVEKSPRAVKALLARSAAGLARSQQIEQPPSDPYIS